MYRVEIIVMTDLANKNMWHEFVKTTTILVGYLEDLKDNERASQLNRALTDIDNECAFYDILDDKDRTEFRQNIIKLSRLLNDPSDLLTRFSRQIHPSIYDQNKDYERNSHQNAKSL